MNDFIFHKKNYLPQENCNKIIELFDKSDNREPGTIGNNRLNKNQKSCIEEFVYSYTDNHYNYQFLPFLTAAITEYQKKYPFLTYLPMWNLAQTYKVQKYEPGEAYFKQHCENDGTFETVPEKKQVKGPCKRMITWMFYLNTVKNGGGTDFPTQQKRFKANKGDLLIWPAGWTHPHCGVVSKTEIKYIMTGWYTFDLSNGKYNVK